jgi:hypothetical protein
MGNKWFFVYEFFKYPELGGYYKNQRPAAYTGLQLCWAIIKQEQTPTVLKKVLMVHNSDSQKIK